MKFTTTALPFLLILFLLAPLNVFALQGLVIGVKDGDTVRVRTKNGDLDVRLYGIDTPETAKRDKPGQPYGKKAENFTNAMVRKTTIASSGFDGPHCCPARHRQLPLGSHPALPAPVRGI